jgi:hypothetical protein
VVQMSVLIEENAVRLGATRGLWCRLFQLYTRVPFSTIGPVLLAESLSWTGVLSGNSLFYCAEYHLRVSSTAIGILNWLTIATTCACLMLSVSWRAYDGGAGMYAGW